MAGADEESGVVMKAESSKMRRDRLLEMFF